MVMEGERSAIVDGQMCCFPRLSRSVKALVSPLATSTYRITIEQQVTATAGKH